MKAIRIHQYGDSDVLQRDEISVPSIKEDEILIRVHAAGINPVDWKVREGYLKDVLGHSLPLVLGWDAAGEVVRVGENIKTFKPGDAVFAFTDLTRGGTYADFIVTNESEVAMKPVNVDENTAAAVPLAALTAWQALFDVANVREGQKVLIHAAAGGVGHLAVQLAKWKGAYVVGTASAKNHAFLNELGVDEILDYNTVDWDGYKNTFDMVFDTVGGDATLRSWPLLKKSGVLVNIVDPTGIEETAQQYGVRGCYIIVSPNAKQLEQIATLIEEGKIHPHVSHVLPYTEVKEAHKLSQQGHVRGKMVLNFNM